MNQHDHDTRDIEMLRLRSSGMSLSQVASALGMSRSTVSERCSAIRQADLAESGEAPSIVNAGYW